MNYETMIFNRWGAVVFHGHDQKENWDGTLGGDISAPAGVYPYLIRVLDYAGNLHNFKGSVNLLK